MSNYIPEEQEGQLDQSEQGGTSAQQLGANYKQFDPNHPPVAQPKNPTPAASQKATTFDQQHQIEESEQEDIRAQEKVAYPDTDQATISSFTPTTAAEGGTVTVKGSGFTGTTAVKVNTVAASFTVNDDSTLSVVVPTGTTGTSGKIVVSAPSGTSATRLSSTDVTSSGTLTVS